MNNIKLLACIVVANILSVMIITGYIKHHSVHPQHGNVEYVSYNQSVEKHPIHGMIKRVSYEVKLGCNAWDSC